MRKLGEHYMQSIHRERKKKNYTKKEKIRTEESNSKKKKQGNSGKGEGEEKRVLLKDCDHSWRHIQQKKIKRNKTIWLRARLTGIFFFLFFSSQAD